MIFTIASVGSFQLGQREGQIPEWQWQAAPRLGLIRILILFIALLPASAAFAQGPYTLSGNVKQPDGFPAPHATISITSSTGLNQLAFSDDMGRFEFANLSRGRYSLAAVNPIDPDQYMDPVVVDLSRNMTSRVTVNLYLRYRTKVVEASPKLVGIASLAEEKLKPPKQAQKSFDRAIAFRNKRNYEGSLENFTKAILLYPEYCQAVAERGHLLIAMKRPAEAARDFTRALEIVPGYGPALRGAGLCAFQQGRFSEAIQLLDQALDAEPGNPTTYLFMGATRVALDQREQARAALQKALNLDPNGSARAHVYLANIYIREGRSQEAIQELNAYLKAVPNAPDAAQLRQKLAQLRVTKLQP